MASFNSLLSCRKLFTCQFYLCMCIYRIQVQISFYWATAKATTEVSECERETLIVFPPAALKASPVNFTYSLATLLSYYGDPHTLGPVSDEVISISFILAPAPFEGTDKALNYLSVTVLQVRKGTYDCFLCGPSSCERCGRIRCGGTVLDLFTCEVSFSESSRSGYSANQLGINPI